MATQIPQMQIQIPVSNGMSGTTKASMGQIRWNTSNHSMEIWYGTHWHTLTDPTPTTWREWFDYYVSNTSTNTDQYARRETIHLLMQTKFPGQYRVDLHNGTWQMIHDTPADETWFHLQYV